MDHMIQNHNLGAKFHRSTVLQSLARKISREFMPGNIGRDDERLNHRGSLRFPLLFFPALTVSFYYYYYY